CCSLRQRLEQALLVGREGVRVDIMDAEHAEYLTAEFDWQVDERTDAMWVDDVGRDAQIASHIVDHDRLAASSDTPSHILTRRDRHGASGRIAKAPSGSAH